MKTTRFNDVSAGSTSVSGMAGGPVGGDLGGGLPAPSVTGLQGYPICATTPVAGQILTFNGTEWCPASGGSPSGTLPWFDVTDAPYGAVGDGTTDDTAAINLAIAALNTATRGVLYFPAGTYKCTSALTTITAVGLAMGDGTSDYQNSTPISELTCTSQTAVLFTITSDAFRFEKLALTNTYAGTPSAGAGIQVSGGTITQRVDYEDVFVTGFYVNIDVQVGCLWTMHSCEIIGPVLYGLKVRNTVNADAGDWSISDSHFTTRAYNATSAIRVESSGGGKIANVKVNCNSLADAGTYGLKKYVTGLDLAIPTGTSTSVLTVTGSSFENISGDAIAISTTGTGQYGLVAISGCQCALYSNNTGRFVNVTAAATGGFGTAGGIGGIVISGCVARTDGTARAAIALTKTDNVVLTGIALSGFNAAYTGSSDTNTHDRTGGIALGVDITGTPSSGYVPTATSSSAATWQAPNGGVTISGTPSVGQVLTATSSTTADWETPSSASATPAHAHVQNVVFSGDGATTAWVLPAAPVDAYSVSVFVGGSRSQDWTLSGTLLDTITFGSAPASASNNIVIDITAALA